METIEIGKINVHDRTFCVSYPLEDDLLFASVAQFGILMPLGLLRREPPVIVTGFKRLEAAKRLGIEEIPCVFLDVSERQALLTAIMDNLGRPLNTIEKARGAEKMLMGGFSTEEVYGVMKLLGLPPGERALGTAVAAACAEEVLKAFVVRHRLPLFVVEQLLWFDPDERALVFRLVDPLNASVASLREILQLLMLLKVKRGGIALPELGGAEDMDALRRRVKGQTHPVLSALEGRLRAILAASALPPHIKVQVDPAFEKESIDIVIRARSNGEVEEALGKVEGLFRQGLFRDIFELTHGAPHRN
jgi:ParB-like chromosome segregation protein Spo0J